MCDNWVYGMIGGVLVVVIIFILLLIIWLIDNAIWEYKKYKYKKSREKQIKKYM